MTFEPWELPEASVSLPAKIAALADRCEYFQLYADDMSGHYNGIKQWRAVGMNGDEQADDQTIVFFAVGSSANEAVNAAIRMLAG